MRCIVAGGRDITDYDRVRRAILLSGWTITEVVSGEASGVDTLGEQWAKAYGIPIKGFPVSKMDWRLLGPAAGPIRNGRMAAYAAEALPDAGLILVWDGQSKGSRSMRALAIQHLVPVFEDREGVFYLRGHRMPTHVMHSILYKEDS